MKAMHIEPQGGVDADLRAWPSNTVSRIECVTSWVSTLKSKSKLLLLSVAAACLLVIALASTLTLQGLPVESHSRPVFPVLSGPSVLSFVAIGDWGRRNRDGQEAVAPALGAWAAKAKAPFVVSVGDNFYDDGVQDASDPLFNASFLRPYDAPSLHVPW